jgi:hypothetical protein
MELKENTMNHEELIADLRSTLTEVSAGVLRQSRIIESMAAIIHGYRHADWLHREGRPADTEAIEQAITALPQDVQDLIDERPRMSESKGNTT